MNSLQSFKRRKEGTEKLKLIAVLAGGWWTAFVGLPNLFQQANRQHETIIPISTERQTYSVSDGNGSSTKSQFLVMAKRCDGSFATFVNKDKWLIGKFNSSTVQGEMAASVGKPIRITTAGYRFGPFSWYRNINKIDGPTVCQK